jgi:Ca2+-binding RTX toxin-like protein
MITEAERNSLEFRDLCDSRPYLGQAEGFPSLPNAIVGGYWSAPYTGTPAGDLVSGGIVDGAGGDDDLDGSQVSGGDGNDLLRGLGVLDGGSGTDAAVFGPFNDSVKVTGWQLVSSSGGSTVFEITTISSRAVEPDGSDRFERTWTVTTKDIEFIDGQYPQFVSDLINGTSTLNTVRVTRTYDDDGVATLNVTTPQEAGKVDLLHGLSRTELTRLSLDATGELRIAGADVSGFEYFSFAGHYYSRDELLARINTSSNPAEIITEPALPSDDSTAPPADPVVLADRVTAPPSDPMLPTDGATNPPTDPEVPAPPTEAAVPADGGSTLPALADRPTVTQPAISPVIPRPIGSSGDDHLQASAHGGRIYGVGGDDVLMGSGARDRLSGGTGDDHLLGRRGNDELFGGYGQDSLKGEVGRDILRGGTGDDWLNGGRGNDRLLGGLGSDTLVGGLGNDVLTGGSGADVFVMTKGSGRDVIMDWQQDDRIDVRAWGAHDMGELQVAFSEGGIMISHDQSSVMINKAGWMALDAKDFVFVT